MAFKTEYEFILPRGYVDENGEIHKKGIMRLATAADEIMPMKDPRVQQNPGYLTIILLARVITSLEGISMIDVRLIEKLFTADLAFLQDLYQRINQMENPSYKTVCPHCGEQHDVAVNFMTADQ